MPEPKKDKSIPVRSLRGVVRERKKHKERLEYSVFVNTMQLIGFSRVNAVKMYKRGIINFSELKYNNTELIINKLTLDGFIVNNLDILLSRYKIPITFLNCILSADCGVVLYHCNIENCEFSANGFVKLEECNTEKCKISALQIHLTKCNSSSSYYFSDKFTSFIDCKLSNMHIESDDGIFESCEIYNSYIKLYELEDMSTSAVLEAIKHEKYNNDIDYQYICKCVI